MKHLYLLILALFFSLSTYAIAPITGPAMVCTSGPGTITLSDATPSGTWSSSNPAVASVDIAGVVTGHSVGTVTITYTVGVSYVTAAMTAVDPPPAIVGASSVYIDATITLTNAVSGGYWRSSRPTVATVDSFSGVVTGINFWPAPDSIIYTLAPGCAAYHDVTVLVPPPCSGAPLAGFANASSTTICSGSALNLFLSSATVASGLAYQWQDSLATGTIWNDIPGGNTRSYTHHPAAPACYRCRVSCVSSGLYAYSESACVVASTNITSYSTIIPLDTVCRPADFHLSTCRPSTAYSISIFYGDGTSDNTPFATTWSSLYTDIFHWYASPGTYTVKEILFDGTSPMDSVTFTHEYLYCKMFPVKLFVDMNTNGTKEPAEPFNAKPVRIEVDSNSIPIDTISVTSGFYYKAKGATGDVYSFILLPGSIYSTLTSPSILRDTIQSLVNNYPVKYLGLNCTAGFDLAINPVTFGTGGHLQSGCIYIQNNLCQPTDATVTCYFDPKWNFFSASPTPSAVSGKTISWNVSGLVFADGPPVSLYYHLNRTTSFLPVGDTVLSYFTITPTIGDADPSNNAMIKIDTVRGGWDPNEISVNPPSCLLPGQDQLQYTINFENTGNDTAHNIHIMDTLSDNVDPRSLQIVMASATMNIAMINDGGYNVVKFDFPGINILDSSHHGLCDGAVIFNIKARAGLPLGSNIVNRAGIYFDYNDVVMTNTVHNTIGCPTSVPAVSNSNKWELYPNPTANELTIKMDKDAYRSYTITNSIGQVLLQYQLNTPQTTINIKTLPPGLYYIALKGGNGTTVQKFVKM